jgi:gliding motility-associated protein GldM
MGHGKETPRQKMIGMMYLVLTAMLALNVSKSVLDAFVLIDDGLMKTTLSFVQKNQSYYDMFEAQMEQSPNATGPHRDKAHEVKKRADELAFIMQEYKVELVIAGDGAGAAALEPMNWPIGGEAPRATHNVNSIRVAAKDNKDRGGQLMIVEGRGDVLKEKIEEYREFLISAVTDDYVKNSIRETLSTDEIVTGTNEREPWSVYNFNYLPLIAVITNLTKLQGDVRRTENEVIQYLLSKIGASDARVNKMEAVVLSRTNFVLTGGEWQGRVVLAAYDSLQRPEILLGNYRRNADGSDWEMVGEGTVVPYDAQGRAIIRRSASSVGTYPIQGLLRMNTPDGFRHFRFSSEYQVGAPNAVVSPTAMNVLYMGIENPISVSVSGAPSEGVSASINNGRLTRSGNGWIAVPSTTSDAVITVTANIEGQSRNMGSTTFRVRRVPTPIARISGRTGGAIPRADLANTQGVEAFLDGFMLDMRYRVTGFTMIISSPQGDRSLTSSSHALTADQRAAVNNAPRGTNIIFTGIRASNDALGNVDLNPLVLRID